MITVRLATSAALRGSFGTALLLVCLGPGCTTENPGYTEDPGDMTPAILDGTAMDLPTSPDQGGGVPDLPETPDIPLAPDTLPSPDLTPVVDQQVVPDLPMPQDYAVPDQPPPVPDLPLPPPDKALPKPDQKVLFNNGTPCTSGTQCKTGFCVDKVCCSGPCKSPCMACHLTTHLGKCTFLPAGTDLDNDCKTVDKVSTCKLDGKCNGLGGCRYYPKGTVCEAAKCQGADTSLGVRLCDGGGTCLAGTTTNCFPYNCNKTTTLCYTSCTAANEIAVCSGYFGCDTTSSTTGTCRKSCLIDAHCNKNGECDKGKCVKD